MIIRSYVKFDMEITIYNPSDFIKVISNLRVEIFNEKGMLLGKFGVGDVDQTKRIGGLFYTEDIKVINVHPKYADLLKGRFIIHNKELKNKFSNIFLYMKMKTVKHIKLNLICMILKK